MMRNGNAIDKQPALGRILRGPVFATGRALAHWLAARAARGALHRLDDAALAELGLARPEIETALGSFCHDRGAIEMTPMGRLACPDFRCQL